MYNVYKPTFGCFAIASLTANGMANSPKVVVTPEQNGAALVTATSVSTDQRDPAGKP